jgi:hypothetical protein
MMITARAINTITKPMETGSAKASVKNIFFIIERNELEAGVADDVLKPSIRNEGSISSAAFMATDLNWGSSANIPNPSLKRPEKRLLKAMAPV